jgi:hypothetical protein
VVKGVVKRLGVLGSNPKEKNSKKFWKKLKNSFSGYVEARIWLSVQILDTYIKKNAVLKNWREKF